MAGPLSSNGKDEAAFVNFITEPLSAPPAAENQCLLIPGKTIDLESLTAEFRKKYILKALELCGGSKVKAAAILGYNNYQNLSNEMKKLNILTNMQPGTNVRPCPPLP